MSLSTLTTLIQILHWGRNFILISIKVKQREGFFLKSPMYLGWSECNPSFSTFKTFSFVNMKHKILGFFVFSKSYFYFYALYFVFICIYILYFIYIYLAVLNKNACRGWRDLTEVNLHVYFGYNQIWLKPWHHMTLEYQWVTLEGRGFRVTLFLGPCTEPLTWLTENCWEAFLGLLVALVLFPQKNSNTFIITQQ